MMHVSGPVAAPPKLFAAGCLAAVISGSVATADPSGGSATSDSPPPGVEQLLPRGRIAAVFEPTFVPASEAELPDDAWVLGVAIGDEARAYSLNLLNSFEVVNDRIGEKSFAAVW